MTDVTDYLTKVKETRQRIVEAGMRHAEATAKREAMEAERARRWALARERADRTKGMPPADAELRNLIVAVLIQYDVTWADIISQRRMKHLHPPRQDVYAILRARKWSYPIIARFCGRKDHTSIIHAMRNHKYRMERQCQTS